MKFIASSPYQVSARPFGQAVSKTFVDSLLLSVGNLSKYAPGTQIKAKFDPETGLLMVTDRLTRKTLLAQGRSENVVKGHIPYGEFEILSHATKGERFRLDAVDNHIRDDVADFNGAPSFVALRLHDRGQSNRTIGCILISDNQEWGTVHDMISKAPTARVTNTPESYRIWGYDIKQPFLRDNSIDKLYGTLEVKKLTMTPVLRDTEQRRLGSKDAPDELLQKGEKCSPRDHIQDQEWRDLPILEKRIDYEVRSRPAMLA